jgi:hypothetical protein
MRLFLQVRDGQLARSSPTEKKEEFGSLDGISLPAIASLPVPHSILWMFGRLQIFNGFLFEWFNRYSLLVVLNR